MTMDGDEVIEIEVPRSFAGKRFDKALAELLAGPTCSQVQKLVRRGKVKLDGRKVLRSNISLRGGERITVRVAGPKAGPRAAPAELELLLVDERFAVVSKPAGMLTHPAGARTGASASELAVAALGPLPTIEGEDRAGIVHRLDRETSGLMVLARDEGALELLRDQFRERTVAKAYEAIVYGLPSREEFLLDQPLGPVPGQKDLQRIDPRGRAAVTDVAVLERAISFARLQCKPRTGRRHQLRVHLASAGHPIVGDKLYRPTDRERLSGVRHHALHARRLAFDHPGTGERVECESPPPQSFEDVWRRALESRRG